MPTLSSHQSDQITKMLLVGDSGTGKTGSLISLVKQGYRLRIMDMDNGLDILRNLVARECPDKMGNIEYETIRDKTVMSVIGPVIQGQPVAFTRAIGLLDKWSDGTRPADWGPEYVFVIDSLTHLSNAAMAWAAAFKVPTGKGGQQDGRAIYGEAQKAIEAVLAALTGEAFKSNVIVTAHITYQQMSDGLLKGFPTSAGTALGPKIPTYFNSIALCERVHGALKPQLRTAPTALLDLKNPASFDMQAVLPVDTGLADFFRTVRGPVAPTQTLKAS